jgi:uncharacterized protein (DUF2164 family)
MESDPQEPEPCLSRLDADPLKQFIESRSGNVFYNAAWNVAAKGLIDPSGRKKQLCN